MITRAHCMQFIGQRVVAHTTDGMVYHGYLQSVTNRGVYMRGLGGRTRYVSASEKTPIELLDTSPQADVDGEEVFFPFFFLPFFALAAFYPWGYWW